jgi:hypothetical protein
VLISDCDGSEVNPGSAAVARRYMAICYPDATVGADFQAGYQQSTPGNLGHGVYPEFLATVAIGDTLMFWDPTNKNPGRDVNAQYRIAYKNTNALNQCIVLDMQQGTQEGSCNGTTADGCDLIDRGIREVTLGAAVVPGQRNIIADAAAVDEVNQRQGRFLTCPVDYDNNGTADVFIKQTVAITDTITSGTDTIRVMPGGFKFPVPNASICHIDYGWQTGDLFSVYRPALIGNVQNATCSGAGTPVACCLFAGGAGNCGAVTCARGATCDFDFVLEERKARDTLFGPSTTFDNVWIREPAAGLVVVATEGPGPFNRLQITSPSWEAHYIQACGHGTTTINDSVFRHWGDDLFLTNYGSVSGSELCTGSEDLDVTKIYGFNINRVRAEYRGCLGGSCNLFESGHATGGPAVFQINDFLAKDATNPIDTSSDGNFQLENDQTSGRATILNSTWIANNGLFLVYSTGYDGKLDVSNIYDIGRTSAGFNTQIFRASSFIDGSFIDMEHTSGDNSKGLIGVKNMSANNGPFTWSRLLFLDYDIPGSFPLSAMEQDDPPHDLSVTDFAVISPQRTGQVFTSSSVLRLKSTGVDTEFMRFNRVTIGLRPSEEVPIGNGFYGEGNDTTFANGLRTLDNFLGVNFWTTTTVGPALFDATDTAGVLDTWCGINNEAELNNNAALSVATQDARNLFVDPSVGNYQPTRGSVIDRLGCGARNVGARDMWALRTLGHNIYAGYGDTWKTKRAADRKGGPRATP